MRDGFIKAAAVTPKVKVADVAFNKEQILLEMKRAAEEGAAVIVFPELCITGYSCRDLFLQESLLREAVLALLEIAEQTKDINAVVFVGLPYVHNEKLYNVAAALCRGQILDWCPRPICRIIRSFMRRDSLPRDESPGADRHRSRSGDLDRHGRSSFLSSGAGLVIGVEICEDLWTPDPPGTAHCLQGANMLVNLSASDEATGKQDYRRQLVASQSARLYCGYVYASAGEGESTQDVVYSGTT